MAGPSTPKAPRFRKDGALGPLRGFQVDPLAVLTEISEQCGDYGEVRLGPVVASVTRRPEDVEHILIKNVKNYRKRTRGYRMMKKVLGLGLVTSEGDFWRRQRRIAQPAFSKRRVESFANSMTAAAERMVNERWAPVADAGSEIDVSAEMMRVTLEIVSETMLSIESGERAEEVAWAVPAVLEHIIYRTTHMFSTNEWIPLPRNRHFRHAMRTLHQLVEGIIRERRKTGTEDVDDLLSMLMEARDSETGETMTDRQLRDEVMTTYLAGHETTASALSWTFYLLSQNAEAEARLFEELDQVLGGKSATLGDLSKLDYTKRVIQESMRLFPPVWFMARMSAGPDTLGGYAIPKNRLVFFCPWVIHHHEALWPDAMRFDPDRFLPSEIEKRPKLSYIPFSAGQRKCIGDHFAMMEAQLILATVLSRYRPRLVPGHAVIPQPTITLRMRDGIRMTLEKRD